MTHFTLYLRSTFKISINYICKLEVGCQKPEDILFLSPWTWFQQTMKCNTEERRAGSQSRIQELHCKYGFTQIYTIFIIEIKHTNYTHFFFFFFLNHTSEVPLLIPKEYIYVIFFCITFLKDSKWITMILHQDPKDNTTTLLDTGQSVNESWQRSNLE